MSTALQTNNSLYGSALGRSLETPTKPLAKQEMGYPMYWNIGFPRDEFIPQLQGLQGLLELERMWNTDETIGAMMWLIESTITQVDWKHTPMKDGQESSDPEAVRMAEFADSLLIDMSHSC